MTRVLIVDDDPVQLRLTSEIARKAGYTPVTATGGDEALRLLRTSPGFAAMILDLVMPDRDGLAVMEQMAREKLTVPVIVQTAHSAIDSVISAMRQGAADFFVKPVAPERLMISLRNAMKMGELESAIAADRHRRDGTLAVDHIITGSPAMERALTLARKAARSPIPVLLEGETGTGKEMFARVIHGMSDRASKPFVAVNCGAIPENLVESTLFGHKRGAFTGAIADQLGKFAEANGGTLFLDEIGELPLAAQAKLLRALQEGQIDPIGATRPERVNVRVISATNRRLLGLAQSGEFREDLFYRLNVFPVYLPPLRERNEDISLLARHFTARFAAETRKPIIGITSAAYDLLNGYAWPGNVRQLENVIYRAVILADAGELDLQDFPQLVADARGREETARLAASLPVPSAPVHIDAARPMREKSDSKEKGKDRFIDADGEVATLDTVERDLIEFAIKRYGGRMSKVARALGIGRSTLYRKLKDYGLEGDISDAA